MRGVDRRHLLTLRHSIPVLKPRREHSRKPEEFYETVRRVTAGPRLDVFSREKHNGFTQYGNETDKFEAAQ